MKMIHLILLKKRIEGIDGIGEVLVFETEMKTDVSVSEYVQDASTVNC